MTEKYLSYQERNAENRRRKRRLRREVRDERAKEQSGRLSPEGYKQQVRTAGPPLRFAFSSSCVSLSQIPV